jgi:hypothetical protein
VNNSPVISEVRFTPARQLDREDGLLGWLRVRFEAEIEVDGACLRRTLDGRLAVTWPQRLDGHGRPHRIVHLTSGVARRSVESQILDALREQGVLQ